MIEFKKLFKTAIKKSIDRLGALIVHRELYFISIVLVAYCAGLLIAFGLLLFSVVTETQVVSFTISTSCVSFLLGQVAFVTRAKSIERNLQLKNTLASLMQRAYSEDRCVVSYIRVGDQKAELIEQCKAEAETTKEVVLDLSLLAIDACNAELQVMLNKKRIERFGNEAFKLTHDCYQFARETIDAVALASNDSLHFWLDADGVGKFFYEGNKYALQQKKVKINRYFVFSQTELRRLHESNEYRFTVVAALSRYIEELPKSSLHLARLDEEWRNYYPETGYGDTKRVEANRKFKKHYATSVPDVSLFDDSVASLWRGAASNKIDEVRIAWEPMHVACVRDIFKTVLANRSTIVVTREWKQTAEELLDSFLRATESKTSDRQ